MRQVPPGTEYEHGFENISSLTGFDLRCIAFLPTLGPYRDRWLRSNNIVAIWQRVYRRMQNRSRCPLVVVLIKMKCKFYSSLSRRDAMLVETTTYDEASPVRDGMWNMGSNNISSLTGFDLRVLLFYQHWVPHGTAG